MTLIRHIAAMAIICVSAAPVTAQDLTGEVNVEREILPVEREATPLTMLPRLSLPALPVPELDFSSVGVRARITPEARFAEPALRPDPLFADASRGYLELTAGPLFNTSLSAGYRPLQTRRTSLGVWLQYDSEVYSRNRRGDTGSHKPYWRDHDATAAVALSQSIGDAGTIDATAFYGFSRTNAYIPSDGRYWVNANRGGVNARWNRHTDALRTSLRAAYGYFGYNPCGLDGAKGARQSTFSFGADGAIAVADSQWAMLGIDLDMAAPGGTSAFGTVSITPAYRYSSQHFTFTAGPRIDLSFNAGKAFHIAPEVKLGWNPNGMIGVEFSAAGGEHLNTLSGIAAEIRRTDPTATYGMSHIPATFDLSVTAGPWRGAWVTLSGGWARANSWLMPAIAGNGATAIALVPTDISGFHAGVAAGADITRYATIAALWQTAQGDTDKGYYLWRDRARNVVEASLTLRPVSQLAIKADWTLRTGRAIYTATTVSGADGSGHTTVDIFNLGNISDIGISATWRFSRRLNASLRATNLLGRDAFLTDMTPQRGLTVMASVCWLLD